VQVEEEREALTRREREDVHPLQVARQVGVPPELLAGGDARVVDAAAVVGGVGLEDGHHDLGHPLPDGRGRPGLAVVGGAPEVVVLGDRRVVLQEAVQVLRAVLEIVLPARDKAGIENVGHS
jgi:hypothetical protein